MMTAMTRTRAALLPAGIGAVTAIAVLEIADTGWAIIAAGLAGTAAAAFAWQPAAGDEA